MSYRINHRSCFHGNTPAERAKCRRQQEQFLAATTFPAFNRVDVHRAWHLVYGDSVASLNDMNLDDLVEVANRLTTGSLTDRLYDAVTTTFEEPGPRLRCRRCLDQFDACAAH